MCATASFDIDYKLSDISDDERDIQLKRNVSAFYLQWVRRSYANAYVNAFHVALRKPIRGH